MPLTDVQNRKAQELADEARSLETIEERAAYVRSKCSDVEILNYAIQLVENDYSAPAGDPAEDVQTNNAIEELFATKQYQWLRGEVLGEGGHGSVYRA